MGRDELRTVGEQLLGAARALRAAYPDATAMGRVTFTVIGARASDDEAADFRAALRYLLDEMLVVRGGAAGNLIVLDDEIANVERLLSSLSAEGALG